MFKRIPLFPNYEISSNGIVRSINGRKGSRANINNGIIKGYTQKVKNTYYRKCVSLRKDGKTFYKKVHRLILETFVGPCPKGMEACHINGNSLDNRLENLRWGTHSENVKDSIIHGNKINPPIHWGENHPNATLSDEQVKLIRETPFKRGTQAMLAKKYNVAPITIRRLKNGESRSMS